MTKQQSDTKQRGTAGRARYTKKIRRALDRGGYKLKMFTEPLKIVSIFCQK